MFANDLKKGKTALSQRWKKREKKNQELPPTKKRKF